jgi:translation initiation factor 1 (eIF-1/SUI1)
MAKRKGKRKREVEKEAAEFRVNPFSGLDLPAVEDDDHGPETDDGAGAGESAAPEQSVHDPDLLHAFGGDAGVEVASRRPVFVRVREERRRHHTVTVIDGLVGGDLELDMERVGQLKQRLGRGARIVDNQVEIQGSRDGRLQTLLEEWGFTCR